MEYDMVWREERVNAFALAGFSHGLRVAPPVALWRKSVPVRTDHFLLDAKVSPPALHLSELGVAYARSLSSVPFPLKYGIVISSCIQVPATYEVFASLCAEGWLSLWHPSAPLTYYSGRRAATLVLVQTVELPTEVGVGLLDRERAGGNFYCALTKTFSSQDGRFVVSPARFEQRRQQLLRSLSERRWILGELERPSDHGNGETLF
jgi:hypothetical protein